MGGRVQLLRLLLLVMLFLPPHLSPPRAKAAKPDLATITELVRGAVANYKSREAQLDSYTYLAHVTRTEFDRNSKPRDQITGTDEIMMLEGAPYRRTVLLNGRPLSPEQKDQQKMILDAEANARRAGHNIHPVHNSFLAPIAELPDEFRLRWRDRQLLDGHEVQVIEALPIDKRRPATSDQEYAHHFKMTLWIDVAEAQFVRVESQVVKNGLTFDQDSVVFFPTLQPATVKAYRVEFARGTVADVEWTKVNDEVWLPKWSHFKTPKETYIDLSSPQRAPLSFPVERTTTYSDYKKFRVDTRVVPK